MTDFQRLFDKNPDYAFFYNAPAYAREGNKLVVGTIDLHNAINRKEKFDEFYVLVTYKIGEQLPEYYVPISGYMGTDEETMFATINPDPFRFRFNNICNNNLNGSRGGIQKISRFDFGQRDWKNGLPDELIHYPNYLLGPGEKTIKLIELIDAEYLDYCKTNGIDHPSLVQGDSRS